MAGAPLGNQNATKGRIWSQSIERALAKRSKHAKIEAMDTLAEKLLEKCDEGDMAALKELGDRLEGKPAQALTIGNPEGEDFRIAAVDRRVVDPKNDRNPTGL